ncbi:MAG: hypothetical protein H6Q89_2838, partial [Myxococcaceae bacterium]|nr:hypothetical protein [Myxococcaceae bacterium]
GHLIAMKLLANRRQDQADLDNLLQALPAKDRRQALQAVAQIMSAGRGDGRDLVRELKALLLAPVPFLPRGLEKIGLSKRRAR